MLAMIVIIAHFNLLCLLRNWYKMKIFKEFLDALRFKGNIKKALTENKKLIYKILSTTWL